jgi:hypothetical protein
MAYTPFPKRCRCVMISYNYFVFNIVLFISNHVVYSIFVMFSRSFELFDKCYRVKTQHFLQEDELCNSPSSENSHILSLQNNLNTFFTLTPYPSVPKKTTKLVFLTKLSWYFVTGQSWYVVIRNLIYVIRWRKIDHGGS